MRMQTRRYNREVAVSYAHTWAYDRNPAYYNYDEIGGDCTNFASQCLYAGARQMNFTPTFGWYYNNANDKAPAWTGVPYFYNFLTRAEESVGPFGREVPLEEIEVGDFIQIRFTGQRYGHTPIVVSVGEPPTEDTILVAAHSFDADNRPLSTYYYEEIRCIHIDGVRF